MSEQYFNKRSWLHIVVIIVFVTAVDFLLFKYLSDFSAISIGYYLKFVICVGYIALSNKFNSSFIREESLEAASHIILLYCCLWVTIINLVFWPGKISSYIGLILIVASLNFYIVASEIVLYLQSKENGRNELTIVVIKLAVNSLVILVFAFALYLIAQNVWEWELKSPLEMLSE